MNTKELRNLQKKLQQEIRNQKFEPVPIDDVMKRTIKKNWGSYRLAAKAIEVPESTFYSWLRKGAVPDYRSFSFFYLLENNISDAYKEINSILE